MILYWLVHNTEGIELLQLIISYIHLIVFTIKHIISWHELINQSWGIIGVYRWAFSSSLHGVVSWWLCEFYWCSAALLVCKLFLRHLLAFWRQICDSIGDWHIMKLYLTTISVQCFLISFSQKLRQWQHMATAVSRIKMLVRINNCWLLDKY